MRFCLAVLMFVVGFSTTPVAAQTKGSTSYTFKAAYADAYIWRGRMLSDTDTLFGQLGIGMGQWAYQFHYADPSESPDMFSEIREEFTHEISYTSIIGRKIVTYGYKFYDYANSNLPDTQEIFTRVAHDRRWNPTYGISYDFDTYKGYYLDFSVTRFWTLTRRSSLVFNLRGGASMDMDEERNDDDVILEPAYFEDDGINHSSAHVKYLLQATRWLKLETGIDYHYAFDDILYDGITVERDNVVWRTTFTLTLP